MKGPKLSVLFSYTQSIPGKTAPLKSTAVAISKPLNVILFTADDLDRNSLGCFGSKVPDITPHLDHFAGQSMRFEKAFVNAAICVPSRAIIATGLYGNNSGVNGFNKMQQGSTVPLLMEILQANNYAVGILGKVNHSTPKAEYRWDYEADQQDLGFGRSPTLYYEKTKAFLAECSQKDKPFYFMINSQDPHRPFHNPAETPETLAQKMNQPKENIERLIKECRNSFPHLMLQKKRAR